MVCVIVCGCGRGWLSRWVRKGVHFAWHTHGPASKEPIRFVQHDADDPSQPALLLVVTKELRQPARRRDHDVRPASELRRLILTIHPSDDSQGAHSNGRANRAKLIGHLGGELVRRYKHNGKYAVPTLVATMWGDGFSYGSHAEGGQS